MRLVIRVVLLVAVIQLCLVASATAAPLVWEDYPVAPTLGGSDISVEIERASAANTYGILDCYVSSGSYPLRYMEGSGNVWNVTTVSASTNGASRVGLTYHPLTGTPYVSYQNGGAQILSHYDGATWTPETAVSSGAAGGSSLGFDPATDQPAIAYGGSGSVSYAWQDMTGWHTETIDSGFGSFHSASLRFDPLTGEPCVAYSHTFNGTYFARRTGPGAWDIAPVQSMSFPYYTVLEFNPVTGRPGIAYETSMGAPVNYAAFNGSGWDTWQVSTPGHTCWDPVGLAYLDDGTPLVAYTAGSFSTIPLTPANFRLAWMPDNEFVILSEPASGDNYPNSPRDLLVDNGAIHVAYISNTGTHYAAAPAPQGSVIPEPATLVLLAAGLIAVTARRRKRLA